MKKYKIKNIGDIFSLPEEFAEEFFSDLITQYYLFKRSELKFKSKEVKDSCIMHFTPDGKNKNNICDIDGKIIIEN